MCREVNVNDYCKFVASRHAVWRPRGLVGACVVVMGCSDGSAPNGSSDPPSELAPQAAPSDEMVTLSTEPHWFTQVTGEVADGARDAAGLGHGCSGWIGQFPDHRIRVPSPMPFVRLRVVGVFAGAGAAEPTIVLRAQDGTVRCSEDLGDTVGPRIDGPLQAGDYDVFIGDRPQGRRRYWLDVMTEALSDRDMDRANAARTPGAIAFQARLGVVSATGVPLAAGDDCLVTTTATETSSQTGEFHWVVRCGTTVLYDASAPAFSSEWSRRTMANDLETTAVDGSPSFEWNVPSATVRDDDVGPLGAIHVELTTLPLTEHAP
jgi:hypothetical protein